MAVFPISNCPVSDAWELHGLMRTNVGGLRPPLSEPISGALLQIQRLCLRQRLDHSIAQAPWACFEEEWSKSTLFRF